MAEGGRVAHIDADSFFASVETALRPQLRGQPVAVVAGGGKGMITACTYEARKAGVSAAMPSGKAKTLCRGLILVPSRMRAYQLAGAHIMETLRTQLGEIEQLSIDEAFCPPGLEEEENMQRARRAVKEELGLNMSAGVGSCKAVAKMASEAAKPDGLKIVTKEEAAAWLAGQPIRNLPGIGPASANKLEEEGLRLLGQVAREDPQILRRLLGRAHGEYVWASSRGEGPTAITPKGPAQSASVEKTFTSPLNEQAAETAFEELLSHAVRRLEGRAAKGASVSVATKWGQTKTKATGLAAPSSDPILLAEAARKSWQALESKNGARLVGVTLYTLGNYTHDAILLDGEQGPVKTTTQPPTLRESAYYGMQVTHRKFGHGTVRAAGAQTITVQFDGETKILDIETAALTPTL